MDWWALYVTHTRDTRSHAASVRVRQVERLVHVYQWALRDVHLSLQQAMAALEHMVQASKAERTHLVQTALNSLRQLSRHLSSTIGGLRMEDEWPIGVLPALDVRPAATNLPSKALPAISLAQNAQHPPRSHTGRWASADPGVVAAERARFKAGLRTLSPRMSNSHYAAQEHHAPPPTAVERRDTKRVGRRLPGNALQTVAACGNAALTCSTSSGAMPLLTAPLPHLGSDRSLLDESSNAELARATVEATFQSVVRHTGLERIARRVEASQRLVEPRPQHHTERQMSRLKQDDTLIGALPPRQAGRQGRHMDEAPEPIGRPWTRPV